MSTPKRRRTRFIHVQRHKATCGPVAIANFIKWAGVQTSYRKVVEFCADMRAYSPTRGMFPFQMRYVLLTMSVKFRVRKKYSTAEMNKLLESGGACIFVYETKAGTGHVVFIDRKLEHGYRAWNRKKGMPPFFSFEDMEETIARSSKNHQLYVYTFQALKR